MYIKRIEFLILFAAINFNPSFDMKIQFRNPLSPPVPLSLLPFAPSRFWDRKKKNAELRIMLSSINGEEMQMNHEIFELNVALNDIKRNPKWNMKI